MRNGNDNKLHKYVKLEKESMEKTKAYVLQAQQGDEKAFEALYHLYHKKAYYTALKISNFCEADAQDIVQDTFMEIHRSIKNLQNPEYFKTWMTRILISKSSHKFRDNRDMFVDPETISKMEGHQEQRPYMVPGKKLNDDSDKEILLKLVDQLKPKQKEVLVLQYFHHMSIKEMAEVLEVPEGTVKTRTLYARTQLAELVSAYEKKEGRKIGFQVEGLGAILSVAFLKEYDSLILPKALVTHHMKSTPKQQWLYTASISACAATVCIATAMGAFTYVNDINRNQNTALKQQQEVETTNRKEFTPVMYRGVSINNCRDAYYTLKEWSQNTKRMELRAIEEKEEIKPVYDSLKQYQGVYYEKLIKENWTTAFEAK